VAKDKETIRKALAPVLNAMFPKKRVAEAARFGRLFAQGYINEEAYNGAIWKLNAEAVQGEASLVSEAGSIIRGFYTPQSVSEAKRYSFAREIKEAFAVGANESEVYAICEGYVNRAVEEDTEESEDSRESLSATLRNAVNAGADDSTLFNALKTFEVNQETKKAEAAKAVKAAK
jgi:hypothetical protein